MSDLSWASRYLIDHDYTPTPEFRDDLREMVAKVSGTERGADRSDEVLERTFENVVLEYALADALGLEMLHYRRFAADIRDNDMGGVRIDVKRQKTQYFERVPAHLGSVWDNRHNIDLIVTGDYRLVGRVFRCRFKQAFLCSSLFKRTNSDDGTWSPSGLLKLSRHDDAPAFKRSRGVLYYDHPTAAAKGVAVYRKGTNLCA